MIKNEQLKTQKNNRGQVNSQPALRIVVKQARSVNFDLFCCLVKLGSEMRQTSTFSGNSGVADIGQYMEL
jgi:hypothetical protein